MGPSKHENVRLKPMPVGLLTVRVAPWAVPRHRGILSVGKVSYPCSIGMSGLTRRKKEGDGASPIGVFSVREWRFQPVRPCFPRGRRSSRTIRRDEGWCDDPSFGAYNRQVRLPFKGGHELLWREDGKYRVVGILDYNLSRRKNGAGSAIFFHLCDDGFSSTAGCVAVRASDMRKILPRLSRRVRIKIG